MTIKLNLPTYLNQWLVHEYGDEEGVVRLPNGCAEHDVIELLAERWPEGEPEGKVERWNTQIHIPEFKGREPEYYHYMTAHAKKMLAHVIYVRFRAALWHDLFTIDKLHLPITDAIYDWMERHGIEPTEKSWEALRQMYFRQRTKYRKNRNKS